MQIQMLLEEYGTAMASTYLRPYHVSSFDPYWKIIELFPKEKRYAVGSILSYTSMNFLMRLGEVLIVYLLCVSSEEQKNVSPWKDWRVDAHVISNFTLSVSFFLTTYSYLNIDDLGWWFWNNLVFWGH